MALMYHQIGFAEVTTDLGTRAKQIYCISRTFLFFQQNILSI